MPLRTKRIYDPPSPDDGFRLLIMRLWPRGIRKDLTDAWDRGLAPSRELLAEFNAGTVDSPAYRQRFLHEMATRPDSIEALASLRALVDTQTVTLLCSCKDENRCHRRLVRELIEAPPASP